MVRWRSAITLKKIGANVKLIFDLSSGRSTLTSSPPSLVVRRGTSTASTRKTLVYSLRRRDMSHWLRYGRRKEYGRVNGYWFDLRRSIEYPTNRNTYSDCVKRQFAKRCEVVQREFAWVCISIFFSDNEYFPSSGVLLSDVISSIRRRPSADTARRCTGEDGRGRGWWRTPTHL